MNPNESPAATPQSSPSNSKMTASPSLWFTSEIQQMMHGFGDCRKPLQESAALIEEIVHQQMKQLLFQAVEVASTRNARFLGIEDFLFLLRRDKIKLKRLIRYLGLKDEKTAIFKGIEEDDGSEQGESKQPVKKRKKICMDFISAIDQTGELLSLFEGDSTDEVKQERALRAELQSRTMDPQQYLEFWEARRTSFSKRYKSQKFKDWVLHGITLDIKPNPLAMEVVSYLAYETVAQVMDLTLLVKRDMRATTDDPFSQVIPSVCMAHEIPASLKANFPSNIKSPSSRTGSPATSPPSTPTTPTAGSMSMMSTPSLTPHPSGSGTSSKSKSKKRKKSGATASMEMSTTQVQPSDVREAVRRYGAAIGPFAPFSKTQLHSPRHRLLCT